MGGRWNPVRIVTAPIHVAGHIVTGAIHHPERVVAPVISAVNPGLGLLAAGLQGAASGGGKGALMGIAGNALGGALGSSLGGPGGSVITPYLSRASNQMVMQGLGAVMGQAVAQGIGADYRPTPSPYNMPAPEIPDFESLKSQVVGETQQAFDINNIFSIADQQEGRWRERRGPDIHRELSLNELRHIKTRKERKAEERHLRNVEFLRALGRL